MKLFLFVANTTSPTLAKNADNPSGVKIDDNSTIIEATLPPRCLPNFCLNNLFNNTKIAATEKEDFQEALLIYEHLL